jgi:hypothetical protein
MVETLAICSITCFAVGLDKIKGITRAVWYYNRVATVTCFVASYANTEIPFLLPHDPR